MSHLSPQDLISLLEPVAHEYAETPFHGEFTQYLRMHAERLAWLVNRVQRHSPPGHKVLDAGSFPGHTSLALHALGYKVTALNPAMEGYASWGPYAASLERRAIPLLTVDLERQYLPCPGNAFDQVLFSEVIEHLPFNPFHAMAELCRVLRPGGPLWLSTPNLASARYILRLLQGRSLMRRLDSHWCEVFPTAPGAKHEREYTARELLHFFAPAGCYPYRFERPKVAFKGWFGDDQPPESAFWRRAEGIAARVFPRLRVGLAASARKPRGLFLMSPGEIQRRGAWDSQPFDPLTVRPPCPAPFPYPIRYLRGPAALAFTAPASHRGPATVLLPMIWHATEPPLPAQRLAVRVEAEGKTSEAPAVEIRPAHDIQVVPVALGAVHWNPGTPVTVHLEPSNLAVPDEYLKNGDTKKIGPALAESHAAVEFSDSAGPGS